jgi:hypothetical protein
MLLVPDISPILEKHQGRRGGWFVGVLFQEFEVEGMRVETGEENCQL